MEHIDPLRASRPRSRAARCDIRRPPRTAGSRRAPISPSPSRANGKPCGRPSKSAPSTSAPGVRRCARFGTSSEANAARSSREPSARRIFPAQNSRTVELVIEASVRPCSASNFRADRPRGPSGWGPWAGRDTIAPPSRRRRDRVESGVRGVGEEVVDALDVVVGDEWGDPLGQLGAPLRLVGTVRAASEVAGRESDRRGDRDDRRRRGQVRTCASGAGSGSIVISGSAGARAVAGAGSRRVNRSSGSEVAEEFVEFARVERGRPSGAHERDARNRRAGRGAVDEDEEETRQGGNDGASQFVRS